ncbi:MAG: hypothetical protein GY749_15680 [Desulfobacteraceae bacterium]|nr:hypothetical protein [Desulfobacteraceae bacterium]
MFDPITITLGCSLVGGIIKACTAKKGEEGKAFVDGLMSGATIGLGVADAENRYEASHSQSSNNNYSS